ncbi:metallophosphoesterase [Sulfurihydrogenibium sp.]|uniref:metallophosphoesterase n=1 Tax=Sulfurihydrogenibium sp. TaxID=2053621 RepID=UPI00262FC312|nr:metallophosphoesterase [Sulfurihydrogenibium sp.]
MNERYLELQIDKPYVVVGDIHGCFDEFYELVELCEKRYGKEVVIFSVGDTIDRGDYNIKTLRYCMELYNAGKFYEVKSNHLDKFYRYLKGNKVKISYGMQKTVDEFLALSEDVRENLRQEIINYYENLPLYIIINKKVVVCHAGIKDEYIGKGDDKVKSFVLYGQTTGKYTDKGFPERLDWTKDRVVNPDSPKIVYGHVVFEEPYINNLCYGIDTGAVLGNKLTGYNPEMDEFTFVKSKRQYYFFED